MKVKKKVYKKSVKKGPFEVIKKVKIPENKEEPPKEPEIFLPEEETKKDDKSVLEKTFGLGETDPKTNLEEKLEPVQTKKLPEEEVYYHGKSPTSNKEDSIKKYQSPIHLTTVSPRTEGDKVRRQNPFVTDTDISQNANKLYSFEEHTERRYSIQNLDLTNPEKISERRSEKNPFLTDLSPNKYD